MTLLALAGSGGFLAASGLRNLPPLSAARAKKPSPRTPLSATAPKPPPISHRNSRRVRPQNWRGECAEPVMPSPALLGFVIRRFTRFPETVRALARNRADFESPKLLFPQRKLPQYANRLYQLEFSVDASSETGCRLDQCMAVF